MSKIFSLFSVFISNSFILVQALETSWYARVPLIVSLVSTASFYQQSLIFVDNTPDKTVSDRIRTGLLIGFSSWLMSAPLSCPGDSSNINSIRCCAGLGIMFGHLGFRYWNKGEPMPGPIPTNVSNGHNPWLGLASPETITQQSSDQTP